MTEKKNLNALGATMDHIFGDLVLGTVGRVAYHVAQAPIVGTATKYVAENLAAGYEEAAQAALRKKMAAALVRITDDTKRPMGPEGIRAMAKEFGVPESGLEDVRARAEWEKKGGARACTVSEFGEPHQGKKRPTDLDQTFPTPAGA